MTKRRRAWDEEDLVFALGVPHAIGGFATSRTGHQGVAVRGSACHWLGSVIVGIVAHRGFAEI